MIPIRPFLVASLLLASSLPGLSDGEFDSAVARAQAGLDKSLAELTQTRQRIANGKIPMSQRLHQLEEQVLERRKTWETSQRQRENQLVDLNVLKAEVKRRNDELTFIHGLISEYSRLFESRIHISEAPRYQQLISDTRAAADNHDLVPAERLGKEMELLTASWSRLQNLMGGATFPGDALTPQGVMEKGQFTLIGPIALFASRQSPASGLAELQLGSPEPTLIDVSPESQQGIRDIVEGRTGEFPLDPTMGNALKIESTHETFFEHIRKGGPVMVPILALGLAAFVIALIKWAQLRRIRIARPQDLQAILSHLNQGARERARSCAAAIKGPVGEMLLTAIHHVGEKKEYIEEVMYEKMLTTKPQLERLMPVIALTAATAPLLGLLGTVTGMINTFNMITVFGTGDPKTLAGGISEALITTEFGLIVAVPALLLHAFISRKAKGVLGSMEQITVGFVNGAPEPTEERSPYVGDLYQ